MLVSTLPAAIKTLLVYTAYQKRFETVEVDYNAELRATGVLQVCSVTPQNKRRSVCRVGQTCGRANSVPVTSDGMRWCGLLST